MGAALCVRHAMRGISPHAGRAHKMKPCIGDQILCSDVARAGFGKRLRCACRAMDNHRSRIVIEAIGHFGCRKTVAVVQAVRQRDTVVQPWQVFGGNGEVRGMTEHFAETGVVPSDPPTAVPTGPSERINCI